MSKTPERLEREMFEIRSRMTPDIDDLRKQTYFVDRWNDKESTSLMKSFERGHLEER